jgi:uncharacterized protein YecT (DUF1311 family)
MSRRTWCRRVAGAGLVLLLGACASPQPPPATETESPLDRCYEGASTRLEVAPCLEKMLAGAETELDKTQHQARKELESLAKVTGRHDALRDFDEAQRAFIRYRDAQCRFVEAQAEPGTGAGDMRLDCMIRLTRSHLREVRAILE